MAVVKFLQRLGVVALWFHGIGFMLACFSVAMIGPDPLNDISLKLNMAGVWVAALDLLFLRLFTYIIRRRS